MLTIASAAAFNSSEEDSNPTCLEGTRVDLLREIDLWARDRLSNQSFGLAARQEPGNRRYLEPYALGYGTEDILVAASSSREARSTGVIFRSSFPHSHGSLRICIQI
jgi:hypothetical protein